MNIWCNYPYACTNTLQIPIIGIITLIKKRIIV